MGNYFGISTAGSTDVDQLVQAYTQTKQPQIDTMNQRKRELESTRTFFTTFNTRLSGLISAMDKFDTDDAADMFVTRKISSNDTSVVSASVNNDANIGNVNLNVMRLATSDTLISNRLNLEDDYGVQEGTYNLAISSGGETFDISFDLDGSETNQEAMNKIVNAINDTEDINVSASMIKDTSSTGRITLVSKETGEDNSIIVNGSNKLKSLGIFENQVANGKNRTLSSGENAGYVTSDASELNSQVKINGITVERNSNSIDDLITGTTINLQKAQEENSIPVSLNTEIDANQVENLIKPLLNSYNATLSHLGSSKDIRRSDASVSTIQSRLRSISTQAITSDEDGSSRYLMEIGIKIGSNGKLSVSDEQKLQDMLKEDPQKVAELFIGSDGFISKIQTAIDGLYGSDGLIQSRRESLTSQIDYTEDRTEDIQKRIDQEAANLRKEYTSYLETFYEAQGQYSLLSTMSAGSSGGGSGYDSLLAQSYGY